MCQYNKTLSASNANSSNVLVHEICFCSVHNLLPTKQVHQFSSNLLHSLSLRDKIVIHQTTYCSEMVEEYKRTGLVGKELFQNFMESLTYTNFHYELEINHQFCQLLQAELEDFVVVAQKNILQRKQDHTICLEILYVTWHYIKRIH